MMTCGGLVGHWNVSLCVVLVLDFGIFWGVVDYYVLRTWNRLGEYVIVIVSLVYG